ncbi:ATP-binding protein [Mycolicibacterium baixiangningiae]|uniref:ATP-binding protein n=1 Tax=Mycolicibacterium baixiangningiae TaxID=2761578 RepID=UPI00299F7F71|nr:LuxR C-terminal-related transcriptional regulator [Mycolicibacterium baixiangningiae]
MPNSADAMRAPESAAVADFLDALTRRPTALMFEGEAGIGKTTVWLSAVAQARRRGLRVLTARASATESVLAYASLADLLRDVDVSVYSALPEPQRKGLYGALLLDAPEIASDPRAVAAGFLSAVEIVAADSPVLIAVDDLQWLDTSSAAALSFASPRLSGAVGLLCTVRTDPRNDTTEALVRMPGPDDVRRMPLQPFSVGALHTILAQRLGRTYSRPMMVRIHKLSDGNPLYALELARSLGDSATLSDVPLSGTLAEVVRKRVGALDPDLQEVLLAAACVARPTVELVARACDRAVDDAASILEVAEGKGIVGLEGHHVRFTHPMLGRAVYTGAASARRRATHRRLARIVDEPELKARHLALGAVTGDPSTLGALDEAAESARMRGAPAAAAELIDLAIGLGGDSPQRRILSARHHFNAGDPARAQALLEETMAQLEPGGLRAEAATLLGYVRLLDDSFPEAADLLQHALPEAAGHPAVLVSMLVTLSFALFNAGHVDAARQRADEAVLNAETFGLTTLLGQALSNRAMVGFLQGDGVDETGLRRALELEDPAANIPMALRPSAHHAVLRSMLGELDRAHQELTALRKRCIEHGDEGDLMFVAYHAALNAIWLGNFSEAALIVEDTVELAQQLGGDVPLSVALTNRALLTAYLGRAEEARAAVASAQAASLRCGSDRLGEWPTNALGFLEVSLGNYDAALSALEPMLVRLRAAPNTCEIIAAWCVPDAVEAMVNLGRPGSAEPLVAALEHHGRRLDRPWMLAIGARCRAMVSAAGGDVTAAVAAAEQAMVEHERLPMPFECARTQLLLGQLQRRQRRKDAAAATLRSALETFERLGTPLWAVRVRAELGRANVGPHRTAVLTPSEQRVAELAASGMTNRNIAMAMFISPKTVEANLSRVYSKLGIHSRAELGRYMGQAGR